MSKSKPLVPVVIRFPEDLYHSLQWESQRVHASMAAVVRRLVADAQFAAIASEKGGKPCKK